VLLKSLRPTDLVARYGGEEFVVLLTDTPLVGACTAGERVRFAIASSPITLADGRSLPPVTISIGVAELGDGMDGPALLSAADALLYRAKAAGRNRVEG
jgi:diguanylate cyclase (GGDEF)-like protein